MGRPRDGYHVIELLPGQARGRLVFRSEDMDAVNARVRKRYGIPRRRPADRGG